MSTETGDTTAAINARSDDRAWPAVIIALEAGGVLRRPTGLKNYYIFLDGQFRHGSLTATRVNRLYSSGVLRKQPNGDYGLHSQ